MRFPLGLIVVIVVCAFVALGYGFVTREERVDQPIAFNHALHLTQVGLTCLDCHTDAETAAHAGLPGKAICLDCHDIDEEDASPLEKAKLFAFVDTEHDIPWRRVAMTKPDVFFSHRRHVGAAGIACLRCHPNQEQLTKPQPTAALVMSMNACIECHEDNQASSDCLACHR